MKYGGVNRSEDVETPKSASVLLTFKSFLVKSHQQRYPLDFCEITLDNSNPRYSPLLTFHFILICFVFLYLIITHQVSLQSSFPRTSYS